MTLQKLNLGTTDNDRTGTVLKPAGQIINDAIDQVNKVAATGVTDALKSRKSDVGGLTVTDSDGNKLIEVGTATINHPDINTIRSNATAGKKAGDSIATVAKSKPGLVVTDANNNVLVTIYADKVDHPDTNAIRSRGAAARRDIKTLRNTGAAATRALCEIAHALIYGQSLSLGYNSNPALTTTADLSYARMFAGGVRPYDNSADPAVIYASLQPLAESTTAGGGGTTTGGGGGQTMAYSAARMVAQLLADEDGIDFTTVNQLLLFSASGQVGTQLAGINNGTAPFARLKNDMLYGRSCSDTLGKTYTPSCLLMLEGETDYQLGTDTATFESLFRGLRSDAETYAQSVAGSTRPLPLITYQTATHLKYALSTPNIALAQLEMATLDDYIAMAAPSYFLPFYSDHVHLTNRGELILGAYMGMAIKRWLWDGVKPKPVTAGAAYRLGNSVIIPMSVPSKTPLALDSSLSPGATFGFQLVDSGGSPIAISSVSLVGGDAVRLMCASAVPSGAQWRYAWTGDGYRGLGGLRDTQGSLVVYDPTGYAIPLHNWLPISQGAIA